MNDLTVQITAEDWRSQNAISNWAQYVKRSASAFAQGYGGQVAFSSLDKSNIPDVLARL
jgi:hypothetical protein